MFYASGLVGIWLLPRLFQDYSYNKKFILCIFSNPILILLMKATADKREDEDISFLNTVLLLICSALSGMGINYMMILQGSYIGMCAEAKKRGFYFGLFQAVVSASVILQSLVANIIFKYLDKQILLDTFLVSSLIAITLALKLPEPLDLEGEIYSISEKPSEEEQDASPQHRGRLSEVIQQQRLE